MKTYFLIDYLAYISVKLLSWAFIFLPTSLALGLGKLIGTAAYYLDVKHKNVAYDNIAIAFPDKSILERKRIIKSLFQNFALNLIELLRLPLINSQYFEKYIEIDGREYIEEALKKKRGLIFLAVHFGSWELSNIICAKLGLTYKVIAREQKRFSKLNDLLNSYRQSQGSVVVTRGISTREIIKSLHKNEVVGMVADQGGKDGSLMDFFGKDASMPTGAVRLALKLEVPVLVAFIVRKNGPFHKVILNPELKLIKTDNFEQDVLVNLKLVVRVAEEMISRFPEHYMWFYKIWKYSLRRSIVILSDGKTGHLRQSQAVANILTEQLKKRGITPEVKIIEIDFKNNFAKPFAALLALLFKKRHLKGYLHYLYNGIKESSLKEMINSEADFVVSTGSSLSSLNYILSSEKSAKAIVILKPGILASSRFDLVVMPQHDQPPKRDNLVITQGAPNLINKEYLESQRQALLAGFPDLSLSPKTKIGFFTGGDTKKYVLSQEVVREILIVMKKICEEFDLELLTTTSRRTSTGVQDILKNEIRDFTRSKLLIIANENNHPSAVGGILSLADVIVVSGESISMISEAAASGKIVLAFRSQPRFNFDLNQDKHEVFLQNLEKKGFIFLCDANNLEDALINILVNKKTTKKLDDNLAIYQALEKNL